MRKVVYEMPKVVERPYSLWKDVIVKNKFVFVSMLLSAGLVAFLVLKTGIADEVEAVEPFSYWQVYTIYVSFLFIVSMLAGAAIFGGFEIFFSGRLIPLSLSSILLYFVFGYFLGIIKFFRDLIRIPFCLIIWISTKVSRKQYEKHMKVEEYYSS